MTMTIKVYEVDRYGRTRIVRPKAEFAPAKVTAASFAEPDCKCPRCKAKQS